MEIKTEDVPKRRFQGFNETFSRSAFFLALAFLYPNAKTAFKRGLTITIIVALQGGQLFWFTHYTLKCLFTLDVYNFTRSMTLAVILILFFIKTYYIIYASGTFRILLDKISADFISANDLDEDCQKLYEDHIKEGKVGETTWLIVPWLLSTMFPAYAGAIMSYESIKSDDFTRLMVHDMDLIFVEDIQSETPFFECYFAYNCMQSAILSPNYCGFDCTFCIATTHLRLKLRLIVLKLQKAFKYSRNKYELRSRMREAIKDHQEALQFQLLVQEMYGPWLFAVFLLTSFMISFNLYQLHLLQRLDPKYTIFGTFGICHIFLPCHYASTLTQVAEEIPDHLYCLPWEEWSDPVATHLLIIMINKSQKKIIVTASGVVVFNMELFKSILQTSYSFFTLVTA